MPTVEMGTKRTIHYCLQCKWAGETTQLVVPPPSCPVCSASLSTMKFFPGEHANADAVLRHDIERTVDSVHLYNPGSAS